MRSIGTFARVACLLLAVVLLGAQFHFCADFTSSNSGSHVCQLCATAGHAVPAQALLTDYSPVFHRFEAISYQAQFSSLSFNFTSPRAPPAL
jgi:hypothetical protein